jgi:hypothetical protein
MSPRCIDIPTHNTIIKVHAVTPNKTVVACTTFWRWKTEWVCELEQGENHRNILNVTRIYWRTVPSPIFQHGGRRFGSSVGTLHRVYETHHHLSVMELGHLLTRSGLMYPEASSKVCHGSFSQLGNSVSLSWVIYYGAFYLHVVYETRDT